MYEYIQRLVAVAAKEVVSSKSEQLLGSGVLEHLLQRLLLLLQQWCGTHGQSYCLAWGLKHPSFCLIFNEMARFGYRNFFETI